MSQSIASSSIAKPSVPEKFLKNQENYRNVQENFLKGNVAVYKVLNLEMLLYKVRWHVSTVKECNLTARPLTLRSRTHSRNVIARVLAIDRACCAGASKRSLPA